ncbi:MAG: DUF1343 domain-containing protein [Bacteroidales bacterium]|nr:DUF1343 domain-containing protein [Bacteroidales bacterium]
MQKIVSVFILFVNFVLPGCSQSDSLTQPITPGAWLTEEYMSKLNHKNVALVCNHTSRIHQKHLVDSLVTLDIRVKKIFTPEHGFRGTEDAGENIRDSIDKVTGIPLVSLYGNKKKPSQNDLTGIDVVVFDIQDIGVRFYTYISTLHYVMEACAENGKELIVLDRPNPNGHYVDGPVMTKKYVSFVGLHPVPIVHGLTIGEYAQMINGEGWLADSLQCKLSVVTCKNYNHKSRFLLEIPPSPNLRNMRAIYLYPSLGLFEGTIMSIGRGTDNPFQVIGHPEYPVKIFSFNPKSVTGAENPKFMDKKCYGIDLTNTNTDSLYLNSKLDLSYLVSCYKTMNKGKGFFNNYFNNLSGNENLKNQIIEGKGANEIKQFWQHEIQQFKPIRKKYLLYEDFE